MSELHPWPPGPTRELERYLPWGTGVTGQQEWLQTERRAIQVEY